MVATRGPVPKRSDMRRRQNRPAEGEEITQAPGAAEVVPLEPDENWHPIAYEIYVSTSSSGQSTFYEPSDWAVLYMLCEQIHQLHQEVYLGMRDMGRGEQEPVYGRRPMSGSEMSAILKGLGTLGATEGDRRRLRVELTRGDDVPKELPPGVLSFNASRAAARRGRAS